MGKNALKFFQAYIREMIDVGGSNLPRAISTKSGAKLGKLYKKRGLGLDVKTALKQAYAALKAKSTITKLDEKSYDVILKYSKKFCPIGGSYNPSRASLFQDNICRPYTLGFLNEIIPQFKIKIDFKKCIVALNQKKCHYILRMEQRKNYDDVRNVPKVLRKVARWVKRINR